MPEMDVRSSRRGNEHETCKIPDSFHTTISYRPVIRAHLLSEKASPYLREDNNELLPGLLGIKFFK